MPSAEQVVHIRNILQAYKAQVTTIVSKHRITVKKALNEADERKTRTVLKQLGKI